MMNRRDLLAILASAGTCKGQGISSRGVKPQPRGRPSGRPFAARFTDVAAQAGLHKPTIYGEADVKTYIIEVVGCGVAFLDYANARWTDLLMLSCARTPGAPACTQTSVYLT